MTIQYDLFNNTEMDQLKEEVKVTRQRTDNIRRGLFARHNELAKMYQDAVSMMESMQKEILWLKKLVEEKHEADIIQLNRKII